MKKEFVIFSDLHLEKISEDIQSLLVSAMNKLVCQKRRDGKEIIFLAAGDINNGTAGFDFLEKLDAKSYYVAGNHEFWENDYFVLNKELGKRSNEKVRYLNNQIDLIEDEFLIVGATLWTDGGKIMNPSIKSQVGSKMKDVYKIKAKEWHINNGMNVANEETNYNWNIDIQIEENTKSVDFFNGIEEVILFLEEIKNGFYIYDNEEKERFNIVRNGFLNVASYKSYRKLLKEITRFNVFEYKFGKKNNNFLIKEETYELFLKLKSISNPKNLKVIFMTHHAPFLEEIFIAGHELVSNSKRLLNQTRDDILIARNDSSFLDHNYLFKCSKGDYERYDDITILLNYYNNLSIRLNHSLIKRIHAWVHGHDHYMNFETKIKNIFVVNNAIGYGMNFSKDKDIEIQMDNLVLNHFRILNEDKMKKDNTIENTLIEAAKKLDFNSIQDELNKIGYASKKLFRLHAILLKSNKCNHVEFDVYLSAINKSYDSICKKMKEFNLYMGIKIDSYMNVEQIIALKNDMHADYGRNEYFISMNLLNSLLRMIPLDVKELNKQDIDFNMQTCYQLELITKEMYKTLDKVKIKVESNNFKNLFPSIYYKKNNTSGTNSMYKHTFDKWNKLKAKYGVENSYMIGGLY